MNPSYNDSFGSFAQPTAVVSDGKSKKRWIGIGVILAILVLTIAIVVVFASMNKAKTGFTSEEKYLNYIVNGDVDNNTDVGTEYSSAKSYAFADAVYLDEYQVTFFENAIELLKSTKLDKNSLEYAEQMAMLEMFKTYKTLRELGTGGVADFYISGDTEGVNTGIMNLVNGLDGNMNRFISSYKNDVVIYVDGIIKMVDYMKANGCEFNSNTQCDTTDDIDNMAMDNLKLFRSVTNDIDRSIPIFIDLVYNTVGKNDE